VPNEVLIKIRVKDESAAGYEEALAEARGFGAKLKEELEKAGKQAGNDAADEIKRQLEELNPPAVDVKVETEKAKEEIHEVKDDLERLDEYGLDIDVHLHDEAAKAEAKILKEELKHELSNAGDAGNSWAKSFESSLKNFDFKPGLLSVGIGVGAAFAPLIGASIAAAVVGGLGLGGIVGGVFIAAKDPRVQSAFSEMKSDLGDALKLDAAPFVPVVEQGIKSIQSEFHSIDLKGIFADLAPQVQPVLNGLLDLVGSLGEALRNVAANSGPVLKELGTDFRNLGNTLEAAFNSLTDNGAHEALALHDLFATLDGAITVTFDLVNALTELYAAFHALMGLGLIGFYEQLQDHSQKVTGAVNQFAAGAIAAADANGELGDSANAAAAASKAQAKAITTVADALKAATDPAFALIDAQKQVNDAQGAYNKAVKTGGQNSKAARDAQQTLEKALINYVGAAGKARDGTGHLTNEQKALLKSAGASDGTIKALDASLKKAYDQAKKLDGFNVDITVTEHFKQTGKYISQSQFDNPTQLYSGLAHGGVSGAANGSTSGGLTWVGERGAELLDLPPGTSVRTAGDSKRDAAAWGAASGGGAAVTVAFDKAGLSGLAAALVETIRAEVRYQGGNVQQVLGQAGR
jgi:hypothetical protein